MIESAVLHQHSQRIVPARDDALRPIDRTVRDPDMIRLTRGHINVEDAIVRNAVHYAVVHLQRPDQHRPGL